MLSSLLTNAVCTDMRCMRYMVHRSPKIHVPSQQFVQESVAIYSRFSEAHYYSRSLSVCAHMLHQHAIGNVSGLTKALQGTVDVAATVQPPLHSNCTVVHQSCETLTQYHALYHFVSLPLRLRRSAVVFLCGFRAVLKRPEALQCFDHCQCEYRAFTRIVCMRCA